MRCVGVGKCRRVESDHGVMCPSFMVTREEQHSTRGRAHLLFEMLHGGPIEDGWRSDAVEAALGLCLACKGCKSDCPVNVDMATYKAEFRSHYYRRRLRPRSAYSMGWIYWWARMASAVPRLANAATHMPLVRSIVKSVGGIAQQRDIPAFAGQTFREWYRSRPRRPGGGPRVLLWPDTFNNYFRPETAIAATEFLEAAGFHVVIPPRPLCCGRPLYDQGMLKTAQRLWRQTLRTLRADIEEGTPLIGLEPACLSAFRDELTNLYPDDPLAQRLRDQSIFFSDFVCRHVARIDIPTMRDRRALVQMHCHQHAILSPGNERDLLGRVGVDYDVMPTGCCGMAGSFGFAVETYDVGLAAGERVLLPKLRAADEDVLVLANGFSCREQIEQGARRRTLHIAELLNAARVGAL
jgi:Fe-S oxidoreductase